MMKRFELIFTFSLMALVAFATVGCGEQARDSRVQIARPAQVINGTLAQPTDFVAKSTALVVSYNPTTFDLRICSSSLITHDLLVTAAHCLVDANSVRLSTSYQTYVFFQTSIDMFVPNFLAPAMAISYSDAVPNPLYKQDDQTLSNDIALIHLPSPAPAGYTPVPILKDGSLLFQAGTSVTLAGFGISTADGSVERQTGTYKLRWMTSTILPYDGAMPSIVAVDGTPDLRTGEGDSGGPALINVSGTTYLFGADSAGNDHDTCYTDLLTQMNWLKATAASLGAGTDF